MSKFREEVNLLDPDFEEKCLKWYEEEGDTSDEESGDNYIESDHDSVSEMDVSDCENPNEDANCMENIQSSDSASDIPESEKTGQYFYGKGKKKKFKWAKAEPVRNVRTLAHNIIRLPMARNQPEGNMPSQFFHRMFSSEMYEVCIQWTNVKLAKMREKYRRYDKPELCDIDLVEMKSFLGVLLYTSIFKSNHEDIRSLFATDGTGREVFRAVMSEKRFLTLLVAMRFDNPDDRPQRKTIHPDAAIHDFFELFVQSIQKSYIVGASATIDEMLVSFRGRCAFKMYIPKKPCKYGIKIQCLTDARTSYVYNAYIYAGKGTDGYGLTSDEKKLGIPTQVVLRLCKPLYNSNRNITTDNWYTSVQAANCLLEKGLTLVGTLKQNKGEIPTQFLPSNNRQVGESLYGFTKHLTLLSYVPKKRKAVVLLSSMHHAKDVDREKNIPEIISWYNLTKGGVDTVDEKTVKYSCSRRTCRWPMAIFYKIIDICSVNSYIVYSSAPGNELSRFDYIKQLCSALVEDQMRRRLQKNIPRELKSIISRILKIEENPGETEETKLEIRKYYYICPSQKKRKTCYICFECKRPICLQCSRKCCLQCCENKND